MSNPVGAQRYGLGGGDAYYDAVKYGGYTGTREQFGRDQAEFAQNATAVAEAREEVEQNTQTVVNTAQTFTEETVPAAIQSVEEKGDTEEDRLELRTTELVEAVNTAGAVQVQAVRDEGTTQTGLVSDAGTAQVEAVEQAGSDQVDAVEQVGADQVQAVTDEGTTQVGAVTGEGDTQVQRVQDKGEEVRESIPADYTALDQEVDTQANIQKLEQFSKISTPSGGSGYIDFNNGDVVQNTGCYHTDYIDLSRFKTIKYRMVHTNSNIYTSKVGIAFYDASKTYMVGFNALAGKPNGYGEDIIDVPDGSVYARFSYWNDTNTYGDFYLYGISKLYDATDVIVDFINNKNLFNKDERTNGKFVQTNNGNLYDNTKAFTSDFIPIKRGTKYSYHVAQNLYGDVAAARLPLFDADKNYMAFAQGTVQNNVVTVTIQPATYRYSESGSIPVYCRFSDYIDQVDNTMFVEGDYPSHYYGYGANYLPNSYHLNETQILEVQNIIQNKTLYGKKIAYNGDSIAESRLAEGNTYNGGAYAKMIADIAGGTYENRSQGGGILASAPGDSGTIPHCVVSDVTNMASDADLICFEGGINDYWRDVPLGDYTESDYSGTLDTTTLCGALESIFRQATQKWIGKPICFVIVHKIKSTAYVANSAGWTFAQGREKMIGICKKYSIPFYDAFAESGLNAYNDIQNTAFLTSNISGTADGCHPNAEGYKKYYVPQLIALFDSIMPRN